MLFGSCSKGFTKKKKSAENKSEHLIQIENYFSCAELGWSWQNQTTPISTKEKAQLCVCYASPESHSCNLCWDNCVKIFFHHRDHPSKSFCKQNHFANKIKRRVDCNRQLPRNNVFHLAELLVLLYPRLGPNLIGIEAGFFVFAHLR